MKCPVNFDPLPQVYKYPFLFPFCTKALLLQTCFALHPFFWGSLLAGGFDSITKLEDWKLRW